MFKQSSQEIVQSKVMAFMKEDCNIPVSEMAKRLGFTEGEVTSALSSKMMLMISGVHARRILEMLPEWGELTTIVSSLGSIFEFKGSLPKGKVARGYYNLIGKAEGLHGHLLLDHIAHVAIVSKPFRGKESHYIGFYAASGDCIFKVYLGRDDKRQLIPEQVKKLQQLKEEIKAW